MGNPHRREYAVAKDPQEGGEEIGEHRRLPEGAVAAEQAARGDEPRLLQVGVGVDDRGVEEGVAAALEQVYQANRQGPEEEDTGNPQAPAVPHQAVEAAAQAGPGGGGGGIRRPDRCILRAGESSAR